MDKQEERLEFSGGYKRSEDGESGKLTLTPEEHLLYEGTKDQSDLTSDLKALYETLKLTDPNAECPSCRSNPLEGTCEVCGAGKIVVDKNFEQIPLTEIDRIFIPHRYRTEKFSSLVLKENKKEIANNKSFDDYCKLLDAMMIRLDAGVPETRSFYISAPSGFGKETFAYTMLQIAMSKGMKVFPYLDLEEAERLMKVYPSYGKEDPIVEEIGFTDVEMYQAKILILKVPHTNVASFLYKVMLTIIDRRARRGLPTIILSRYRFNYFTSLDKKFEARGIESYSKPTHKNLQIFEMIL